MPFAQLVIHAGEGDAGSRELCDQTWKRSNFARDAVHTAVLRAVRTGALDGQLDDPEVVLVAKAGGVELANEADG